MPRRTRECFPQFDSLEPRALFDAAPSVDHEPASHNKNLSDEQIEVFMSASDETDAVEESTATSDADMYAAFLTKPAAKTVKSATGKVFLNDDDAWGRDRSDDPTSATKPTPVTDDQAPIITAAAHGDAKAIAIMLTWDRDDGTASQTITSSTGKPAADSVKIQSGFVGSFYSSRRGR